MRIETVDLPENSYEHFASLYDEAGFSEYSISLLPRIRGWVRERQAARILDLACGTGSVLAGMRDGRTALAGLDASPAMIARAREKLPRVPLFVGTVSSLPVRSSFDMVLCLYDSLNYLTEERDLLSAFREARRVVDGNGLFVFDVNNWTAYREVWEDREPYHAGGRAGKVTIRPSFSPLSGIGEALVEVEKEEEGLLRRYRSLHRQRWYGEEQLGGLLEEAGWEPKKMLRIDPFPTRSGAVRAAKDLWLAEPVGG